MNDMFNAAIDALQAECDSYRDGLGTCKGIITGLQAERDELKRLREAWQKEAQELLVERDELRTQLEAALKILEELALALPKNKSTIKSCYAIHNDHRDAIHATIAATKGMT